MNAALLSSLYHRKRHRHEPQTVTKVLSEASSDNIGYWMIPVREDAYAKLIIHGSYQVGAVRHPTTSGEMIHAGWAIIANRRLLERFAGPIVRAVDQNIDVLTSNVGSTDWREAMTMVEEKALSAGWAYYVSIGHVGYFRVSKMTSVIALFGKEYYGGELQRPESVKPQKDKTFNINLGKGWRPASAGMFKKFVRYHEEATYTSLGEIINDWKNDSLDWANANHRSILNLCSPESVNPQYRTLGEDLIRFLYTFLTAMKMAKKKIPFDVNDYSPEVKDGLVSMSGKKKMVESSLTERMTFAQLLGNTKTHGKYVVGGLRKVDGKWINDPAVPGRVDNARFVIAAPPLTQVNKDGSVTYRWKFRSRIDRSTTDKTHLGYLRMMPKKKGFMAFLKKLVKGDGPWEGECEVWCSCPDFRFRMGYANWRAEASHKPTGQNGDSTLEPPVKTNPKMIPMLCKHLAMAGSVFLQNPPKKLRRDVEEIQRMADEHTNTVKYEPVEPKEEDELLSATDEVELGGRIEPTTRV